MLVGLLRPTSGTVRLNGFDMTTQSRQACQILAYVPDEPLLYEKLTGREFLEFIAGMYGLRAEAARRRVEREIEQFELGDFVEDLAESYSHGMKQRLVFAAALLHDPLVLVIDEPMVGLDPRSTRLLKDLLRRKAAEGMTIFMSTHTLALAEEIATRIGIFAAGRLCCQGTLETLRSELAQQHMSLEQIFLDVTGGADVSAQPVTPVGGEARA